MPESRIVLLLILIIIVVTTYSVNKKLQGRTISFIEIKYNPLIPLHKAFKQSLTSGILS